MPTTSEPENTGAGDSGTPKQRQGQPVSVQTPDFAELDAVPATGNATPLENLLDVSVSVTAELGRATTSIGEILKLNVGSVVELERLVSDPVDLVAQGIRLARGEVVIVEDRFAIRIREIVDQKATVRRATA